MSKDQTYILVAGGCLVALCAVGALVAGIFYATTIIDVLPTQEVISAPEIQHPQAEGLSLGDPNTPATIDVFEDFQCPACQYFTQSIEPQIITHLVVPGKARFVFHHYPFIDGPGAGNGGESDQAANASMCANEQGRFWDMQAIIFANWNGENRGHFNDRFIAAMAGSIGLDMDTFNACYKVNKYQTDIQADYDLGDQMGVSGTPSVFVNGGKVGQPGKIASFQEIAEAVDRIVNSGE